MANTIINEGTTAIYTASLIDETGAAIPLENLDSLTLTLCNKNDFSIINSRNAQDILNNNDVVVSADGVITWEMQPEDNIISSTKIGYGHTETHIIFFEWEWDNNTKKGNYETRIDVKKMVKIEV